MPDGPDPDAPIDGEVDLESPAVQSYLTILQSVISRMASNSAGCKTWCIALVSAIVVIIADKGARASIWVSLIPIVLFLLLDSYYLGLERSFRDRYNAFIRKLHAKRISAEDLFVVAPPSGASTMKATAGAFSSFSIWPFYGLLAAMLLILRFWLLA